LPESRLRKPAVGAALNEKTTQLRMGEKKMETITLGHSGLEVSALCLGILPFGTKVQREDAFAILDAYFEAGGRFIDTANNYSKWHAGGIGTESETTLGEWVQARGNRNELVIATKVGFNRDDIGPSLSRATIEKEIDGSLSRIATDYVDLYYAHADIRTDGIEETLAAFDDTVKAGKARFLGCSNYVAWRIAQARAVSRANGWSEYCCVQQRYTYLRPAPGASFAPQVSGNDDLLDYCREHTDFRMLAYSPLLNGAYSRDDREIPKQYVGPDSEARLTALQEVAAEYGATVNQIVYAWLLGGDTAVIPLTAPTTLEQLSENLGGLTIKLSEESMRELSEAGNP
jgi:aryl-alcohol dehydrogenase-like predicted oxidoreductase